MKRRFFLAFFACGLLSSCLSKSFYSLGPDSLNGARNYYYLDHQYKDDKDLNPFAINQTLYPFTWDTSIPGLVDPRKQPSYDVKACAARNCAYRAARATATPCRPVCAGKQTAHRF